MELESQALAMLLLAPLESYDAVSWMLTVETSVVEECGSALTRAVVHRNLPICFQTSACSSMLFL